MTIAIENAPTMTREQLVARKGELSRVAKDERDEAYKTEWQQVCDALSHIVNADNAAKMKKFAIACKPILERAENSKGERVSTPGANLTSIILSSLAAHHGGGFKAKDKQNTNSFTPTIAKMCQKDTALLDSSVAAAKAIFAAAVEACETDSALEVGIILGVKTSKSGDRNAALDGLRTRL